MVLGRARLTIAISGTNLMADIIKLCLACYDEWLKNVIIMAWSANAAASVQV